MSSPIQYALTIGPLGFYLGMLAFWNSGRHPRVVSGLLDFALLACALGGILAFGPFGDLALRLFAVKPDWLDRIVLVSAMGLWASFLARKALHRVVVFHVDAEPLQRTLGDLLNASCGRFVRTLGGFEDREQNLGLKVEFSKRMNCAVIEAFGANAEALIQRLRPRLREAVRDISMRRSTVALAMYGACLLVMILPFVGRLLSRGEAREAFRGLIHLLRGG